MHKIIHFGFKSLFFILFFQCSFITINAQNSPPKNDFWQNVRFGGGVGIGFNNAGYNASIAPSAIYQVSNSFATGINTNFIFSKVGDNKISAYGGGVIALYNPIDIIQLSTEFEQLRVNQTFGDFKDRFWAPALFLGAGYTNRYSTIGIRYNLLQNNSNSIYLNAWVPFVRFYF